MSINDAVDDIKNFHRIMGQPVKSTPQFPIAKRASLRLDLIAEEYKETVQALTTGQLEDIGKELCDLIVVCIGTALEYGIPLANIWEAVHASNMAKIDPHLGVVKYRHDGKVLKPEGWKAPDVKAIVEHAKAKG